jgi:hypothetical protein
MRRVLFILLTVGIAMTTVGFTGCRGSDESGRSAAPVTTPGESAQMPSSQQAMLRAYEDVRKTGLPKARVLEMFGKPDFEDNARFFTASGPEAWGPAWIH